MSVDSIKYDDICDKCAHAEYCDMATFGGHNPKIVACGKFNKRHQTNGDRIRSMTDEELASYIDGVWYGFEELPGMCDVCESHTVQKCSECWLDWLKQEAEP